MILVIQNYVIPFIRFKNSYNLLSTQGEAEKLINICHVISITKCTNLTNKIVSTLKTRIKLIGGEVLDVKETIDEILHKIEIV